MRRMRSGQPKTSRAEEVAQLLRAVSLASQRYAELVRNRLGLNRRDLDAMGVISARADGQDPISPGELAQTLRLSAPAVSLVLDRLEAVGHVERRRHPLDRRRVELGLTDTAMTAARRTFTPLQESIATALQPFSTQELETAISVLRAALGAFAQATTELDAQPAGRGQPPDIGSAP